MWAGAWPSAKLVELRRGLDALRHLVDAQLDLPDDVASALARFLVIRTCGYIEQVAEEAALAYVSASASPRVDSFARSWFGRGANPTPGALVAMVRRFDNAWGDELKALFDADDELLSREISFLVDRRNKIAHGLPEGIGARKALDLVESVLMVADWFVETFDPRPTKAGAVRIEAAPSGRVRRT